MVYDIEFIRRVDGQAEMIVHEMDRLIGEQVAEVIIKANELFRQLAVTPRPDGYRIREMDGPVVYEFVEAPKT